MKLNMANTPFTIRYLYKFSWNLIFASTIFSAFCLAFIFLSPNKYSLILLGNVTYKWLFGDVAKMQKLPAKMQKNRNEISNYRIVTKKYNIEVSAGTDRLSIPP